MKWSVFLDITLGYRINSAIDALDLADQFADQAGAPPEEVAAAHKQFAAAKKRAKDLIADDVLGPAPAFRVHFAGKAYPDREPRTGKANDVVTVTVEAIYDG